MPSLSQLSEVDEQGDLEVLLVHRRDGAPIQHQNGCSPVPAPVEAGVGALSIGPGSSAAGGVYDQHIPVPPPVAVSAVSNRMTYGYQGFNDHTVMF